MSAKVTKPVCYLLFRLLLPITLLAAAVFRFNALSFLYVVFLLITPLLSVPNAVSFKGSTGNYLKILIGFSTLAVLAQSVFHIVLAAVATDNAPYGSMFPNCSTNERIARQVGVERLDSVPALDIIRLILPDVGVFMVSLTIFIISNILLKKDAAQEPTDLPTTVKSRRRRRVRSFIEFFGEFLVTFLLCISGIVSPSVLSAVYFLTFLVIATLWACYKNLGRKFAGYRVFLLVYTGLHILVLHLYQFEFFQDYVPHTDFIPRLLGLTGIIKTSCASVWMIYFHDDIKWPYIANPGVLLLLYWVLAFETRRWIHKKDTNEVDSPIVTSRGKKRKKMRPGERQVQQTAEQEETGSVVFSGSAYGEPDDIDEKLLVEDAETPSGAYNSMEPTNAERQSAGSQSGRNEPTDRTDGKSTQDDMQEKRSSLVSIFVYVMKQSYVLTLIAMMVWSITYHSWLTFALLLSACVLWMIPKSRKACLLVSPIIVFYAECLLLIQFIFGMNLVELPDKYGDFTYKEIGLMKFDYPCLNLGPQVFYTLFFWLTMRQFMRERQAQQEFSPTSYPLEPVDGATKKKVSFTDFINLHIEVDMVDGYDSNTMKIIGNYFWVLLCKYWIFVCTIMLLLISVQDVVIYRIIYMIFFLLFIITFQLSYTLWRVTMFLFWWVVIIYSMFVLIIIYTYQFHQFPNYWHTTTGWNNETLLDIGLEQYDTATLFVKLLTPTSFLIVVIIQVHYFHKPFLKMSALDRYRYIPLMERDMSRKEDTVDNAPTDYTTDETGATTTDTEGEFQKRTRRWRRRFTFLFFKLWHTASGYWETVTTFLWRLTEIHVFKIMAFIIMIVAASEVYAISAVYVILMAIILPISRCHIMLSHLAQIWTALVILAKMLYQLKLVKTDYWLTNCTLIHDAYTTVLRNESTVAYNVTNSTTGTVNFGNYSYVPVENGTLVDNALWAGLAKIEQLNVSIAYYIRLFILILVVIAFESIVRYHQRQHFNRLHVERPKPGIIFPEIKRPEADRDIKSCLQFFANYLFYKFGLELCYIMTAITVCIRVDVYSVLYAIFLGILLILSRRNNARIWPIYTIILAVLLPVQFMSCVGMPFILCFQYPWENTSEMSRNLEQWLFLPDYVNAPHAPKLIADFFQLLFVCLQWRVFRIELSSERDEYGGGDNHDILPEVEANTEIPVADFTSVRTSYLDVIKYAVFVFMFWVTLAFVFITGLTRVNLFSMGYVIAVFCFMWYGQEFLLKPLRKLRRMWYILIGYTFFVLFIKACLQLVGCVYIHHLYSDSCWLIQLLGVDCLSSTIEVPPSSCVVEADDTGLAWDVICFTFLLLQARIYGSNYFRHVVVELEATNRLASRGAELINRINIREVVCQREKEKEILISIKKKMKALQDKQAKLKKNYVEPDDHYTAIRSGDYYLFEDDSDDDVEDQADTLSFGKDVDADREKKLGPLQIISTAVDSGTDAAVEKAKSSDSLEKEADGTAPSSPKAGTSTELSADEPQPGEEELPAESKAKRILKFVGTFLASIVDWFIRLFNRISKNYRIVAQQLEKEKKLEKEKIQYEKQNIVAKPHEEMSSDEEKADAGASDTDLVEVTVTKETKPPSQVGSTFTLDELEREEEEKNFEKSQPRLYRLLVATYYMLVSRSELLCYFLMILNQMMYCSLLALPLPLMVFLWGMLSLPRPSKTFWITVITYVEAIVVTKYLFQFSFFPWNDESIHESPFWPPRIIGIEKRNNYASADLVLLLAMFIHRSILKRYGLWRDEADISADMARAEMKELSPPCSPQPAFDDEADADRKPRAIEDTDVDSMAVTTGSSQEESGEKPPSRIKAGLKKCVQPFQTFFHQVTRSTYSATVDVYAPMFGCDFIVFLIVVFGYWAFGPAATSGSGDVTSYIQENRIPVPFLIMLISQFALIIIDRALFLRKNVLGKFIFQIFLVILVHVWMFFVLPAVTGRSFSQNVPAMLWYFIKCIYFGLSAYQIRCGYPTRILGNFLTKKYNYLNLFLFKGFLAIPFLLELRALMDWIWTDTTLALGSWLQMEDIYANVFVLKCWRRAEATYPTPRAMKRKTVIKYGVGGLLLLVIIFIIWFPLVFFSFANAVFQKNPPYEATVTITVGSYQPLFKMTAQHDSISELTGLEYNKLKNHYNKDRLAVAFISNYDAEDITKITFNGKSTSLWGISPPSQEKMINDLSAGHSLPMDFYVTFNREPTTKQSETISNEFKTDLSKTTQIQMAEIINRTATMNNVNITRLFPRFIRLGLTGRPTEVDSLLLGPYGIGNSNISMSLDNGTQPYIEWWKVQEIIEGDIFSSDPNKPVHLEDQITVITFNDRKAPAGFSVFTNYGIIGLYVSLVLVLGRFFRVTFFTGSSFQIMFLELPIVDKVLQLCLDIYMVRESMDLRLEEDLFSKLIFLYRSPETMLKWTKHKQR